MLGPAAPFRTLSAHFGAVAMHSWQSQRAAAAAAGGAAAAAPVTVPASEQRMRSVWLPAAGSACRWTIGVAAKDLRYAVYFLHHDDTPDAAEPAAGDGAAPAERVAAVAEGSVTAETDASGNYTAPGAGCCVIVADNSGSWFTGKDATITLTPASS